MSVYLGYDSVTKEYLKSLAGTGSGSGGTNVDLNGFAMTGDINMGGNEIVGLGSPSSGVHQQEVCGR